MITDLVLAQSGRCTRDTQNYPSDFAEVSATHHTQRYPAQVQKRLEHGRESNIASLMKLLISGEIVLMCVSEPKANTLNICCDVFVHTVNFFMTFTACITEVMNRFTHFAFHKVW